MGISKNLLAGCMFLLFGLASAFLSTEYELGTLYRTGPGLFPFALGLMIALLGGALILSAIVRGRGAGADDAAEAAHLRPVLVISLAVVVFAIAITRFGLFPAVISLVLISSFSDTDGSWKERVLSSVVLATVAYLIFVMLLEIRIPAVAL